MRSRFRKGLPGSVVRWMAFAAVVVACIAPAAMADEPTSESTKVTFTSWFLPEPTDTAVSSKARRAAVRAFLREYPQYEIEPFQMPAIQGGGMDTGPLMGIASGNPPHAIYVNFRQSSTYINHGFLVPVEELLARVLSDNENVRETDEQGEWLADPTPRALEAAREKIRTRVPDPVWPVIYRTADSKKAGIPPGKHVWAMPVGILIKALLWRKDVFQEAGLNPEDPPDNWDELLEYAREIQALPDHYGIMLRSGVSISWGVYSFMVSNGVRYMQRDDQDRWHAAFNTDRAAESIHYIVRLIHETFDRDGETYHGAAFMTPGGQDARMMWRNGQVGMQFSSLKDEMLADINPELTGIAPIPKSPRGTRGGELNCRMLGIFSGSTPEQQLAVMEYIWFITSDEAQRIRTRVYVENGYGRFVNPTLLEKFGYDDIVRRVPEAWRETFKIAMESGVPEPYGRNTQFIYHKVSEPINWAVEDQQAEQLLKMQPPQAKAEIRQVLDEAAERVDRYMLGELSDAQWRQRRIVSAVALVLIIGAFAGSLGYVWRSFRSEEQEWGDKPPLRRFTTAYIMLLPALAVVVFWQYIPMLIGAPLALFDYELVIESEFVGIDNFATVLYDQRFWASLVRTFYYVVLVVGLGFWPPIAVAILLDEVPTDTLKYIFRTIFYLPMIVSGVIMVFLWRQLYQESEAGALNQLIMLLNDLGPVGGFMIKLLLLATWFGLIALLYAAVVQLKELSTPVRLAMFLFTTALLGATLWPLVEAYQGPEALQIRAENLTPEQVAQMSGFSGVWAYIKDMAGAFNIEPVGWIHDPAMAMVCVVIPGIWAASGPGCIIYLAALKTVPEDLVEASSIDGAGIIQKICYITLPRIKFLILIQLVGAVVSAFKGGTNFILAMTGGGPNGATRVLGMDIFERTFMALQYGVGAAMAWFLGGLVIVLTAYQLKRMSRAEFKTAASSEQKP